jgi:hypothetical protein
MFEHTYMSRNAPRHLYTFLEVSTGANGTSPELGDDHVTYHQYNHKHCYFAWLSAL